MATDVGGPAMDADALVAFMTEGFGRPFTWPIECVDGDGVVLRCPAADVALRPGGTVSGPTLMTAADSAAYLAVLPRIGPAALAVTANLNITFLRRPRPGDLLARAHLLKVGRTLAVSEVTIHSADETGPVGEPVATATVTYSLALLEGASNP